MNNTSSDNPDSSDAFGFEIDFLPVGEKDGDAICLRWGKNLKGSNPDQFVMVVDGGYKKTSDSVLSFLKHYYHPEKIDLMVNTHPDKDHAEGLPDIVSKMSVERLWMHDPWNRSDLAGLQPDKRRTTPGIQRQLASEMEPAKETYDQVADRKCESPFAGPSETLKGVPVQVLGPTKQYYDELLEDILADSYHENEKVKYDKTKKEIWRSNLFTDEGWTTPRNNSSIILSLNIPKYGVVLLTGDAGIPALNNACDYLERTGSTLLEQLTLFQIPHHGSIQNLGPAILKRLLGPSRKRSSRWACVSVAGTDDPKHPSKHVLNALYENNVSCVMTAGESIHFAYGSVPPRKGWVKCEPIPLYNYVEKTFIRSN